MTQEEHGMTQEEHGMTQDDTRRRMTGKKNLRAKKASSPFCDFFSLGAGVTPAQGSVKPTAGFTSNKVISPSQNEG
jgi:hypothetical protein